jgi:septal ring-binding cell division protein DamX
LVGARDPAAVRKFIGDNRLGQPYAIFERPLDGRPWYSLVAGDYPDRKAAVAARDRLPGGLAGSGAWPRTFESIQKSE